MRGPRARTGHLRLVVNFVGALFQDHVAVGHVDDGFLGRHEERLFVEIRDFGSGRRRRRKKPGVAFGGLPARRTRNALGSRPSRTDRFGSCWPWVGAARLAGDDEPEEQCQETSDANDRPHDPGWLFIHTSLGSKRQATA